MNAVVLIPCALRGDGLRVSRVPLRPSRLAVVKDLAGFASARSNRRPLGPIDVTQGIQL